MKGEKIFEISTNKVPTEAEWGYDLRMTVDTLEITHYAFVPGETPNYFPLSTGTIDIASMSWRDLENQLIRTFICNRLDELKKIEEAFRNLRTSS